MKKKKAVFNWSGGKDSAHALWRVLQSGDYEVVALLTTANRDSQCSTMHHIPRELLEAQSRSIGIPLDLVPLNPGGTLSDYSEAMRKAVLRHKAAGVTHFIFGDIFLHDVRSYRESQLAPLGIEVVEPLWQLTSAEAMAGYLASGFRTVVVTTMADGLGEAAVGREVDAAFVSALPDGCDPNGENGEYHTFCYDGPIFSRPVSFSLGATCRKSFDIRLDDGSLHTYTYCFAPLSPR